MSTRGIGSAARVGFVPVGRGMSLCHGCGALAPSGRTTCEVCGAAIGASLEAVPRRSDDLSFAQVRTHFTCRQCGGEIPLGEPELDEAITCPRCSTRQAFESSAWGEALEHAHFVADVYGPRGVEFRRGLGARDPNPGLGASTATATLKLTGVVTREGVQRTRNLRTDAAPGAPLCEKCGSPREPTLVASPSGEEELELRCVGCGERARYGIPKNARALAPGLVGIVAEAFRTDRPAAKLNQTSAGMVVALNCPNCSAPLHTSVGSNVAVCSFCKTESRIASRTLLAMKQIDGDAPPWWAVFRGDARRRLSPEGSASPIFSSPRVVQVSNVAFSVSSQQAGPIVIRGGGALDPQAMAAIASFTNAAQASAQAQTRRGGLLLILSLVMVMVVAFLAVAMMVGFGGFWSMLVAPSAGSFSPP